MNNTALIQFLSLNLFTKLYDCLVAFYFDFLFKYDIKKKGKKSTKISKINEMLIFQTISSSHFSFDYFNNAKSRPDNVDFPLSLIDDIELRGLHLTVSRYRPLYHPAQESVVWQSGGVERYELRKKILLHLIL